MGRKKKKETVSGNYLDFIPAHGKNCRFEMDEEGKVTIFQENKGAFNRAAQVLIKKPKVSQIHLDEFGNFIWPLMDGKRTILEISVLVKGHFGDKAEPLYDRLVQYMRTLEQYGFIEIHPGSPAQ